VCSAGGQIDKATKLKLIDGRLVTGSPGCTFDMARGRVRVVSREESRHKAIRSAEGRRGRPPGLGMKRVEKWVERRVERRRVSVSVGPRLCLCLCPCPCLSASVSMSGDRRRCAAATSVGGHDSLVLLKGSKAANGIDNKRRDAVEGDRP